jgi:hypothetical protein
MTQANLDALCDRGQQQLMEMDYLSAEATFVAAERIALESRDFDALARLMLPLQEARRQRRQRCGEGIVRLDIVARGPKDLLDAARIATDYPHGQLLIAGWGTVAPAVELRRLQGKQRLYVETFLAAAYPPDKSIAVLIVPDEATALPEMRPRSFSDLVADAPHRSIVLDIADLPAGAKPATAATYEQVMRLWERLHAPFLAAAYAESDPRRKIDACRAAINVDYACELAHQALAAAARELGRRGGG